MLRVTKLTDYATVVLTVLAARPGAVLSAPELAEASGLEQPTVAKLLKPLARQIHALTKHLLFGLRLGKSLLQLRIIRAQRAT